MARLVQHRIPRYIAALERQMERNMVDAVSFAAGKSTELVSRGQPVRRVKPRTAQSARAPRLVGLDPSKPGEPPKVVTARLKQSITWQVSRERGEIVGRWGTNVVYGRALELGNPARGLLPRPYLRPIALIWGAELQRRLTKRLEAIRQRARRSGALR